MRGLPTAERGDVVATCRRKEYCRKIAQARLAGKDRRGAAAAAGHRVGVRPLGRHSTNIPRVLGLM